MRRNPFAVQENFDGVFGGTDIDFLVDKAVGDTVKVLLEFYVVVDIDPSFLPYRKIECLLRQRFQNRLICGKKQLPPGYSHSLKLSVVEFIKKIPNRQIQLVKTEEFPIS